MSEDDVWIETFSGGKFHLLNPTPEEVNLEDIAHSLSQQCRFTGHTREFYSVAEHSYFVSHLVPPEQALAALLHDASEAYLSDLSRPAKHFTAMGRVYMELEEKVQRVIAQAFGIPYEMTPEIKWADNLMLGIEGRLLMHDLDKWTDTLPLPGSLGISLCLLPPKKAEVYFLRRFDAIRRYQREQNLL